MRRSAIMAAVLALTVTVGASPAAAAPARYSFVDLGTLGGESSYANAINDRGQIVGSSQVADGSWHGFVWRAGTMTDLGTLRPSGINIKGDIIGTTDDSAFLLRAGRLIDLGPGVSPTALNDRGQVVAAGPFPAIPFLWSAGRTRMLPLDTVSDINDRGQISGGHQVAGGFHGAVWQRGRVKDLGAGPFDRGNTYGINESGWVIGWQFSPTQFERGILWRAGTPTDIGTLGGELTHLTTINDRGQILGISQLPDGYTHPILWRAGTMTDLTILGVGPDDNLVDLNNRGEIAGSYGTVSGVAHAALWRKSRPTP
jgi:probable HAF family extracellular repeat protein